MGEWRRFANFLIWSIFRSELEVAMPETEGTKTTLVNVVLAFLNSLAPNEWVPGMRSEPWGELLYGLKLGGWTEMGEANWDAHYPLFPDLFEAQPAILRWCLVRWDGSLCIHPE